MQTQKGSATIVIFIVLLLTLGGTVWYFKSFPMGSVPAREQKTPEAQEAIMDNPPPTPTTDSAEAISQTTVAKKARDADRMLSVRLVQSGLDLYYDSCNNSYPVTPKLVAVGSPQFTELIKEKCIGLETFMHADFKPGGTAFEYCSEASPGSGECGTPKNGRAESYLLVFMLETKNFTMFTGENGERISKPLLPGKHIATPPDKIN